MTKRFRVEIVGTTVVVRERDYPEGLPVIEVGFGVTTRRDQFPDGFDEANTYLNATTQLLHELNERAPLTLVKR